MKKSKYIDHTLLRADARKADIIKLCEEARQYDFASVCVNSCWVSEAKEQLAGSDVKVCCVVGFPLGASNSRVKAFEAQDAVLNNGADEIDMVINVGKLKDGDINYVVDEIRTIKQIIGHHILKVIIETCLLTDDEIKIACECAKKAGADFVKTSTGFGSAGANVKDVRLMKECVGDSLKIKASGGIRTSEQFKNMIVAGADRIGTSNGTGIIQGLL